jgi:hypothetical protein
MPAGRELRDARSRDSVGRIFMKKESTQMRRDRMPKFLKYLSLFCVLLTGMLMFGCEGDKGDRGFPGVSTGVLAGKVTNSLTNSPVAGATLTLSPSLEGQAPITTDSNGNYSAQLPLTVYTVTVSGGALYNSQTFNAPVIAGQVTTKNIALVPKVNAAVGVAPVTNAAPGQQVTLVAVPAILNTTNPNPTYTWTQVSGPAATIANGNTATPVITLGNRAAYKQQVATVEAPRQSVDPQSDVPVFAPLNRTQVVGLTNEALVTGGEAIFQVTMTSGSDVVTQPATIRIKPLFAPQLSIRNVPVGQPLLLQGRSFTNNVTSSDVTPIPQTSWNWTITGPAGSTAKLNDPTTINPDFTPDVAGVYTLTETVSGQSLTIYAGTWQGAITGLDVNGDPTANPGTSGTLPPVTKGTVAISGCGCHYVAGDTQIGKFTRSWNVSGHSHIVSGLTANPLEKVGPTVQNITDPNGHWTPQACGPCHTVGFAQYSSTIKANGFSEVYRAEGLKIVNGPTAWSDTVKNFPRSASLMQIQCENCHGPSASPAHTTSATPATTPGNDFFARVSFSSDVCGVCHGEPTRHGKWQQWRASGHGDFETAEFEGLTFTTNPLGSINPSCGGCHTGQGFSALNTQLKNGTLTNNLSLASRTLSATALANPELVTVNLNTVQPQVCVTCHSPHNPGATSGLTDSKGNKGGVVALAGYDPFYGQTAFIGNTPLLPAGFQANGVGKGALCIVCHESRNGEPVPGQGNPTVHEDGDVNWDPTLPTFKATNYQSPHEAAQGDVLMGRNAYFVKGVRSPHSLIADTCVNCHMELMPAPQDLDPARLGTNHNFQVNIDTTTGGTNICAACHGFTGGQIQDAFNAQLTSTMNALAAKIYYIKTFNPGTGAGNFPVTDHATVTLSVVRGVPSIQVTGSANPGANTAGTAPVSLRSYLTGATYKGVTYTNGIIPVIYKSVWNVFLVTNDASEGIHNPSFSQDVLQETYMNVGAF